MFGNCSKCALFVFMCTILNINFYKNEKTFSYDFQHWILKRFVKKGWLPQEEAIPNNLLSKQ